MKIRKIKQFVMVGVLSVCASFGVIPANVSAGSVSLIVSPPNQTMVLTPGESYSGSLVVSNANDSTKDLKYGVYIGSYSETAGEDSKDDYGTTDTVARSNYNQIMDWIELGKEKGVVAPNEKDTIPFTINVPEDAPGGGQYATIIVADETDLENAGNGNVSIQSVYQFASIIYASIAGETREEGEIISNDMPSFLLNGTLETESMVRNNGNVHTDAEYTLQVWPLFSDEEICTNVEEPETSLILPETERYHSQTCELPTVGIFKAKQTVKIFGEESTVEKMLIVCPIWLLFIILFVIAAIVIWLIMQIQKRKHGKKDNE